MNESVLIQRSLAGEIEPFNELVLHYQGLAFSVAYRMLQDSEAAADAVQDSFVKAFRALHTFKGGNFKAWLLRIVTNTCYDVLRSRQRRATESLDDLPVEQEYAHQLLDDTESPEQHAERMELNSAIEQGIQSLPPDQRLALILCDVHGYAYEEIAEITQMPIGTVKSRISRGRAKLRNYLYRQPELLPSTFRPTEEAE
ncbi:MAG: sigma-70 family RNA polymerase sigma factor [Caldilineaceae bacterium]|nr:sigma-70 family RNA polymerase sigma factor [Caldilineaceae bacterium]MCB0139862.1 sigma-70 family RNA polymerase sigma factor [Caldilineaceae bacterium]